MRKHLVCILSVLLIFGFMGTRVSAEPDNERIEETRYSTTTVNFAEYITVANGNNVPQVTIYLQGSYKCDNYGNGHYYYHTGSYSSFSYTYRVSSTYYVTNITFTPVSNGMLITVYANCGGTVYSGTKTLYFVQ